MYKLGRDYPQKREMRRLSEKIFDESKTARRVYLDCRENLFVVAGKLKDAWRYKELGKLTTTDSLYDVLQTYRKSGCCVCKTTAKKMDGSQKVLDASFVGFTNNPYFHCAEPMCYYDKNVMLYHSKKMQEKFFNKKLEKELNAEIDDMADEMINSL